MADPASDVDEHLASGVGARRPLGGGEHFALLALRRVFVRNARDDHLLHSRMPRAADSFVRHDVDPECQPRRKTAVPT